jgi:hypothetical protein
MATIYYATNGPSWTILGNWMTNETECNWLQSSEGYFCDETGILFSWSQSNNTLDGKIPDEIRFLSSLTDINLSMNQISGTVPSELGSLTMLTDLSFTSNQFKGTVPSELGSLTMSTESSFAGNQFTGTVLSKLGSLTMMTELLLLNLFQFYIYIHNVPPCCSVFSFTMGRVRHIFQRPYRKLKITSHWHSISLLGTSGHNNNLTTSIGQRYNTPSSGKTNNKFTLPN